MKKGSCTITIIIIAFSISSTFAQTSIKISREDLKLLPGNWKGALTYLDYTSNKPYTMPAELNVTRQGISDVFIFSNLYPNEPKANASDTVRVSHHGKMINKKRVKSRRVLPNGDILIVTESAGIDGNDNKPAIIRTTYTLGKTTFINIKEVQFVGQKQWVKRHEFSYTRI